MTFPNAPLQTAKGNIPCKVKRAFSLVTALEVTGKNEGALREALHLARKEAALSRSTLERN